MAKIKSESINKTTVSNEVQDKWNQILFENANKCHIHQDNLRWTLSGGFAAFFYGSIVLLHNDKIECDNDLTHNLYLLFFILGSLYWIAVSVEGWYYNLYLHYLIFCEERIVLGENLIPLINYDRSKVKLFHPSFSPILILIATANSYYLYNYNINMVYCSLYLLSATLISINGYLFNRMEITRSKNPRIIKHRQYPESPTPPGKAF